MKINLSILYLFTLVSLENIDNIKLISDRHHKSIELISIEKKTDFKQNLRSILTAKKLTDLLNSKENICSKVKKISDEVLRKINKVNSPELFEISIFYRNKKRETYNLTHNLCYHICSDDIPSIVSNRMSETITCYEHKIPNYFLNKSWKNNSSQIIKNPDETVLIIVNYDLK